MTMKKRMFYIVSLDTQRLLILSILLGGFLLLAFTTGYRMGRTEPPSPITERLQAERLEAQRLPIDTTEPTDRASTEAAQETDETPRQQSNRNEQTEQPESGTERQNASVAFRSPALFDRSNPEPEESDRNTRNDRNNENNNDSESEQSGSEGSEILEYGDSIRLSNRPETTERTPPPIEYSLQIAAFRGPVSANRQKQILIDDGFDPYIVQQSGMYLVRVGKTRNPTELNSLERQLREKDYSPMRVQSR